jgi:hypothetical protein
LSSRHISGGSQVTPDSTSTIGRSGKRTGTPSHTRLTTWAWNAFAIPT